MEKVRVLIIGATGMLGNALINFFYKTPDYQVYGSVRSEAALKFFPMELHEYLVVNINVESSDDLIRLFKEVRPQVVINCVGLVKQLKESKNPIKSILINSYLPHRLVELCSLLNARYIQISTDCVFSGNKGMYVETDIPDAADIYGRSKLLGEVYDQNSITLRTSIIGNELEGNRSLINWFLSQSDTVSGYKNAIFSGLPTVELARVIRDFVLPNQELTGLYHVSVDPISKYDLLKIVADQFDKRIEIIPDDSVRINRSLNSSKFKSATGFTPKPWPQLIAEMHSFG